MISDLMSDSMRATGLSALMKGAGLVTRFIPIPQPTLLVGPGSSGRLGQAIAGFGHSKILIVTDAIISKLGLLKNLTDALTEGGAEYAVFAEHVTWPSADFEAKITLVDSPSPTSNPNPGVYIAYDGQIKQMTESNASMGLALLLGVIFIYLVLASQFESLVHPLTILLSLPLSVPFALASLWLTDGTLNLYSALGILVLFGVVKKNSILQIDHANQLRAKGVPRDQAILDASKTSVEFFSGTRQGVWAVVRKFVPSGVEHILIGPDHLLFLVGLLLLGGTLRQLTLVVSAFTVAHSITLSLAALNLLNPPARIIEPAIALSIIYVGADNLMVRDGKDVRAWPNSRLFTSARGRTATMLPSRSASR